VPTGNPIGQPTKTYEENASRKSRMDDIRETCNVLQNVSFDQAKESVLMFLRDNGKADEGRVMKKVWHNSKLTLHSAILSCGSVL